MTIAFCSILSFPFEPVFLQTCPVVLFQKIGFLMNDRLQHDDSGKTLVVLPIVVPRLDVAVLEYLCAPHRMQGPQLHHRATYCSRDHIRKKRDEAQSKEHGNRSMLVIDPMHMSKT